MLALTSRMHAPCRTRTREHNPHLGLGENVVLGRDGGRAGGRAACRGVEVEQPAHRAVLHQRQRHEAEPHGEEHRHDCSKAHGAAALARGSRAALYGAEGGALLQSMERRRAWVTVVGGGRRVVRVEELRQEIQVRECRARCWG